MVLSACGAVGLTEKVSAATATTTMIDVSNTAPRLNEPVTFTAWLSPNYVMAPGLVNKPATIYHTFNGVRYDDVINKLTDSNGQATVAVSFTSTGVRTYYATFAGDSQYAGSTSDVVTVTVGIETEIDLTASKTTANVNEPVTFTATLTRLDPSAYLANKPVTIYHWFNGVRYNDVVNKLTDNTGKVAVTVSFSSVGTRIYHATFAGDSQYAAGERFSPVEMVVQ